MTSTSKLQSGKLADAAVLLKEGKYQEAIDICSGIILEESDCYAAFSARIIRLRRVGGFLHVWISVACGSCLVS